MISRGSLGDIFSQELNVNISLTLHTGSTGDLFPMDHTIWVEWLSISDRSAISACLIEVDS